MSKPESPPSGPPVTPQSSTTSPAPQNDDDPSVRLRRQKKQFSVMIAGTAFIVMSTIITRRGVARRIRWAKPTYFRQNMHHPEQKFDGGLEALEALSVATVNVFSWSIFYAGGMLWALDIASLEEMRSKLRVRLGLSEEEQKGSQSVVRSWMQAANPWNLFKSRKPPEGTSNGSGSETNEGGAS
jgi:hypothetical protein